MATGEPRISMDDSCGMEEGTRRWEDMPTDCLVNVFRHLGLDDLALAVPFVCRSWSTASRDAACWKSLNFRALDFMPWSGFAREFAVRYPRTPFSFSAFMRFAVRRSRGTATELAFPFFGASLEDLVYASLKCPRLKALSLPDNMMLEDEVHIPELIGRWKDLEELDMESKPSSFLEMIAEIGRSCKRFSRLRVCGLINKEDAAAIVRCLRGVKHLELSKSYLTKEELVVIMGGCGALERLAVNNCLGFEADDEVLEMAARVRLASFEHDGSKLLDDYGYETDESEYQTTFFYGHAS